MTVAEPDEEISAIMEDSSLSLVERMRRKQDLMNKRFLAAAAEDEEEPDNKDTEELEYLKCGICLELCERPVSASCQHNFCLKCFKKYVNHGKKDCPTCRTKLPRDLIQNPRVNTMLTSRLRKVHAPTVTVQVTHHHKDSDRPDEAFTTEHAKRKGLSNACSGRMRVTTAQHHFGPIGPEFDPERGGYEDDKDEGEWLLYTGAGGRDLSGNKRTNKVQSSDQEFEGANKALLKSCSDGLPVRVLRSYKEKRSEYAPAKTDPSQSIRYDGVYRIIAAWRTAGQQGKLMCRYLLRRCDNSPAPWDAGVIGDGPWLGELPKEATEEMKNGQDVHKPSGQPFWDYDAKHRAWQWVRNAPVSVPKNATMRKPTSKREEASILKNLAKCHCSMCKLVLTAPVCTPCGHQFCKACLEVKFLAGAPTDCTARPLRTRKQRKPCPMCNKELADFVEGSTFQVNLAMKSQIEKLQSQLLEVQEKIKAEEEGKGDEEEVDEDGLDGEEAEEHGDEEESEELEEEAKPTAKAAGASTSRTKPSPAKGRPPKSPAKAAKLAKSPANTKPGTSEADEEEDDGDEDIVLPCKKRAKVDAKQRAAG